MEYLSIIDLIQKAENDMITNKTNYSIVNINFILDVKDLILNGFLPIKIISNENNINSVKLIYNKFIENTILYEMNEYEMIFWTIKGMEPISLLIDHKMWLYCSIEGWITLSLRTGNSLPLLLYSKNDVFPSLRPKTQMLMFKQITSLKYNPNNIIIHNKFNRNIIIHNEKYNCLPVSRYASGMSKGLYYNEDDGDSETNEYCGTFYYYEPDSNVYLIFNNYRIYKNKFDAINGLYNEYINSNVKSSKYTKNKLQKYINISYLTQNIFNDDIIKFVEKYYTSEIDLPEDLILTPEEIYEIIPTKLRKEILNEVSVKRYAGVILGLYALEDSYDQIICDLANELDIDVLVLTSMAGSHQIVEEILDVRDRMTSFSCLIYPN